MQPSNGGLPRRVQIRILAIGAVALAALLLFVPSAREFLSARPAPALPVMVQGSFRPDHSQWSSIAWGTVSARKFSGLVTADAIVATNDDAATQVFSPFTGQIMNTAVHAGDYVDKGAALMTVAASEAVQAQSDLVTAVGTQRTAQATAHNADENERRQHALYQDGSAALKDWQQSQVGQTTVRSALQTADAALNAARAKLSILGFVDRQIHALEFSQRSGPPLPAAVLAPISGIVLQRLVGPGQFIQAGSSTPAFSLGNSSTLWLVGNVREEDTPQMRVGEPVEVTVGALPGHVFAAKLTWVAQGIDPTTLRLAVRAELRNPKGLLRPSMFATMVVHTGDDRVSPAVPEIAVVHEGEQSHVWVSTGGDSPALRSIQPGRTQDGVLEVLKGLNAQVGVAIAAMLPNITLSANAGSAATAIGNLFGTGSGFWSIGAALAQPLFDGGALLNKKRAADAALDQARAQYQSAVITAFQNTADALEAVHFDAEGVAASASATAAAADSLARAGHQRQLGDIGMPGVLLSEENYEQAQISLIQARASRYVDIVALFQALGGGWWNDKGEEVP